MKIIFDIYEQNGSSKHRQHISSAIWGHVLTEVLVLGIAPLRELDKTDRHAVTHILITYSDFFYTFHLKRTQRII
jgi:hypothetical protein